MDTTEDRLRKIFFDHLTPASGHITRDDNLATDLAADSLDNLEILIATEDAFDLLIDDADWEKVVTFGDVVDLVERLLA